MDELLHRELKGLPPPRAPRTLLPRVMEAVARRGTVPPVTGWFTWTWGERFACATPFVLSFVAAWLIGAAPPQAVVTVAAIAADAATVMRVARDLVLQPLAVYFLALGVVFVLTCGAAWAAMEFALGGASQR